jgi:septal ring factor EnvC (AmiA/AmiB activator)
MDYPNRGTLWTNSYKKTDAQPDMKGDIKLELDLVKDLLENAESDHVVIKMSAWLGKDKDGNRKVSQQRPLARRTHGMTKKPKTIEDWQRVCNSLNNALQSQMQDEAKLRSVIDNLEEQIGKLEEQLTMSVGVIKYLELQIARSNPVRSDKNRA